MSEGTTSVFLSGLGANDRFLRVLFPVSYLQGGRTARGGGGKSGASKRWETTKLNEIVYELLLSL